MSAVIRHARSRRGKLADAPKISASAAKNGFGRILDRVAREGRLAITKHDEPCAVLISIEEYRSLVGAKELTLNSLSDEFDALFERMQAPGAAAAMQKAFRLTPAQLGRAAVKSAAPAATGGARSKSARRTRG
ncbi:MAG TPA: type II toxin-antitoxin system Phd/YefM family antitoxin [Steroidobacteraceae bacterium]|nr:type II toxin-antitoxin system Phd/YefM family antitoxin [Steroidobacteraceae bacterium]